jgi:hypothetical protein
VVVTSFQRHRLRGPLMGQIRVHEFITLDGVIDTPTWTMDYRFDLKGRWHLVPGVGTL